MKPFTWTLLLRESPLCWVFGVHTGGGARRWGTHGIIIIIAPPPPPPPIVSVSVGSRLRRSRAREPRPYWKHFYGQRSFSRSALVLCEIGRYSAAAAATAGNFLSARAHTHTHKQRRPPPVPRRFRCAGPVIRDRAAFHNPPAVHRLMGHVTHTHTHTRWKTSIMYIIII